MKVLWDLLVDLWNVDDPPDRTGPIANMGTFLAFCGVMLWHHEHVPHQ